MSFTWLPVIVLKLTSSACFANNQGHGGKNIQIVDDYVKHMLSEMSPDWPSIKEELIQKPSIKEELIELIKEELIKEELDPGRVEMDGCASFACHWMHRYGELQASRRIARRKPVISGFFEEAK